MVLAWYRESRGNREGDGIWTAGAGSGRDRAGTLPAEDYKKYIFNFQFRLRITITDEHDNYLFS